jgi:hypothetical protein
MHDSEIEYTKKLWDVLFGAKLDEIDKLPLEDRYDRYIELQTEIDGIKHDMSVNPTDMRDDIWKKFGGQGTDFSGSEDHGGLIHLPTLLFLEGLMNKYDKNPVDNARTTSVILGKYVVEKVMELQRIAKRLKSPSEEQKELIKRSKQELEALKKQQELTDQKNKNGGIFRKVGNFFHGADDFVQDVYNRGEVAIEEMYSKLARWLGSFF